MPTILQFGTGRFLRGFFDCIIPHANTVTVVQSRIKSNGAELINRHSEGYQVWTRGKQDGKIIDETTSVNSLAQGLDANKQWANVVEAGLSHDLQLIVSNTTEAGLSLSPHDNAADLLANCPESYPAKLLSLLFQRYQARCPGITILPLELVEYNANQLCALVKQQALTNPLTADSGFIEWLESDNRWLNNLVDRIVVNVSDPPPWGYEDPLAVVAEPYRMLAIQDDGGDRKILPQHPMILWSENLQPLFIRKVRILNGLHTAMVARSLPRGFETVLDVMRNADERSWYEALLKEEILPALQARDMDERAFAAEVLERFENPFFQHRLADIANGHDKKLTTRIQPTIDDFRTAFGKEPVRLNEIIAAAH